MTQSEGSRRTLEHIERRNLFLVPLDAKREWYRYHHLFADLMRRELELSVAAREIAQLHRRARDWYAHEGAIPDAIHHAFLADDMDQAVELIANSWNDFFNSGELDTVASWLDALPAEAVGGDARLCVARAWLALDRGELEEAADWIEAGQSAAARSPGSEADLAVLRAVHRFKIGDLGEAEKAARDVLRLERDATFARTVGHLILGVSMYWRAASAEATSALEEAAKTAEAMENALGRSYALGYLALTESDDHERKATLAAMATDLGDDPSFAEHFVPMIGHVARAQAEKQAGRLETAERSARRALELSGRGAGRLETALVRVELAEIRHLRGDPDKARGLLREARAIEERCSDSGILPTRVSIVERRLRLARTADQGFDELTDREVAVLRLLTTGLSRGEIARSLYVSDNTVKSHLKGIYRKLDASSRGEAVTRAREQGLL